MKFDKKVINVLMVILVILLGPLLLLYASFYFSYQVKTKTHFTPVQVETIQKELGFVLPEGGKIVLCKGLNTRDGFFKAFIIGVKDEGEFIKNNLAFTVGEPSQDQHLPYDPSKKSNKYVGEEKVISTVYFGKYNGQSRLVIIYETNSSTVIQLEIPEDSTNELMQLFPFVTW